MAIWVSSPKRLRSAFSMSDALSCACLREMPPSIRICSSIAEYLPILRVRRSWGSITPSKEAAIEIIQDVDEDVVDNRHSHEVAGRTHVHAEAVAYDVEHVARCKGVFSEIVEHKAHLTRGKHHEPQYPREEKICEFF